MIDPDLQCAYLVLQTLPNAKLDSIEQVANTAIATLEGTIVMLEARVLSTEIVIAPLLVKKALVENAVDAAMTQANIFNSSITSTCPALGKFTKITYDAMSAKVSAAKHMLNEINRLQTATRRYQADADVAKSYLNEARRMVSLIQAVKNERGAVIAAANIEIPKL